MHASLNTSNWYLSLQMKLSHIDSLVYLLRENVSIYLDNESIFSEITYMVYINSIPYKSCDVAYKKLSLQREISELGNENNPCLADQNSLFIGRIE